MSDEIEIEKKSDEKPVRKPKTDMRVRAPRVPNKGSWKKGQTGNPTGWNISKGKLLSNALVEACHAKDYKQIAEKLISEAKKGNIAAIRELFDRTLPKMPTQVEAKIETTSTEQIALKIDALLGIVHDTTPDPDHDIIDADPV